MTERSDESTSSLTRTADNNVPRLTPNVSTTLRTNDTTPSVPLVGGPVNNHGPNHQHHHYHGTPPAAPAPGVLHSPAPVAVVRTSRRRRLVHSIGAFMHRISRHASNDPPSTTIRGPATTTAHNAATQDHAQHAQDMSTHLLPPPTLGIDQQREGEVAGRLSSDGDDRDKPLPALPQTCSIDLPQNVVPPASFHRNDTPDRVSPAVPTGQGGSGTHAAAAADSDDAHVANTDYNFAGQPVVRYNDFAFKRSNGFSAPEIEGQASLAGAPARHAETNGHFEEDNLACPNSADFGTNAPLLRCVSLPPSEPDDGLGDQPVLHQPLARPNTADFGTNAPLLRCVPLPPAEPDDGLHNGPTLQRPPSTNSRGSHQVGLPHSPPLHSPRPRWNLESPGLINWPSAGTPTSRPMPAPWLSGGDVDAVLAARLRDAQRGHGEQRVAGLNNMHGTGLEQLAVLHGELSQLLTFSTQPTISNSVGGPNYRVPDSTRRASVPDTGVGAQPLASNPAVEASSASNNQRSTSAPAPIPHMPQATLSAEAPEAPADASSTRPALAEGSNTSLDPERATEDALRAYIGEKEVSGMHAGLQLVVVVGSEDEIRRSGLRNSAELIYEDLYEDVMPRLAGFCEANTRHHSLTQFHLCTYRTREKGGQDVMARVLQSLENYLRCLHAVEIVMNGRKDDRPLHQDAIYNKLTQLHHLRIEGEGAGVNRFRLFPLQRVTQLDIKTDMSSADILALVDLAAKLELLVLDFHSSVEHDDHGNATTPLEAATAVRLPHAMHVTADNPEGLLYILEGFAWAADVRLTVTQICPPVVAELFATRQWSLCVRNAST